MSRSKHYLLSFTTLFYNKKGYVLMFNRHKNVAHLDQVPLSFEPWNRYSALIMRDMKMGTKVKHETSKLHTVVTDFATVLEGSSPSDLRDGNVYYLSNLGEGLSDSKVMPTYGKNEDSPVEVKNFYSKLAETIEHVNSQVIKSISLPSKLGRTKIIENGEEILSFEDTDISVLGEVLQSELMNLLNLEGLDPEKLELLTLLPQHGYNQVSDLADLVFKEGDQPTVNDRLLAIQYGEKVVDMAKANYLKVVLDSFINMFMQGDNIEVVSNDNGTLSLEVFQVVGMGFLDEFESADNYDKAEITELETMRSKTHVYQANLDTLDDTVNMKKNIEKVTIDAAREVIVHSRTLPEVVDQGRALHLYGTVSTDEGGATYKKGGRYENPIDWAEPIKYSHSLPIKLDHFILHPFVH